MGACPASTAQACHDEIDLLTTCVATAGNVTINHVTQACCGLVAAVSMPCLGHAEQIFEYIFGFSADTKPYPPVSTTTERVGYLVFGFFVSANQIGNPRAPCASECGPLIDVRPCQQSCLMYMSNRLSRSVMHQFDSATTGLCAGCSRVNLQWSHGETGIRGA